MLTLSHNYLTNLRIPFWNLSNTYSLLQKYDSLFGVVLLPFLPFFLPLSCARALNTEGVIAKPNSLLYLFYHF